MDPKIKKQVLRTFTYGLYAISCADEGEVNIFTANWLTQASFDPPLVAVSIENVSKSLPMILHSRIFTINVLRSGGRELAGKLGKSALQQPDKLAGIGFEVFDAHMSAVEGSIGAIPRRLMVAVEDFAAARRTLGNASITISS